MAAGHLARRALPLAVSLAEYMVLRDELDDHRMTIAVAMAHLLVALE